MITRSSLFYKESVVLIEDAMKKLHDYLQKKAFFHIDANHYFIHDSLGRLSHLAALVNYSALGDKNEDFVKPIFLSYEEYQLCLPLESGQKPRPKEIYVQCLPGELRCKTVGFNGKLESWIFPWELLGREFTSGEIRQGVHLSDLFLKKKILDLLRENRPSLGGLLSMLYVLEEGDSVPKDLAYIIDALALIVQPIGKVPIKYALKEVVYQAIEKLKEAKDRLENPMAYCGKKEETTLAEHKKVADVLWGRESKPKEEKEKRIAAKAARLFKSIEALKKRVRPLSIPDSPKRQFQFRSLADSEAEARRDFDAMPALKTESDEDVSPRSAAP